MPVENYFTDGDFTTPVRIDRARVDRPFSSQGDNQSRVVQVDYCQHADYFFPSALNDSMHDSDFNWRDFPNAYLVEESALEPMGSSLVKFTRTYAEIPKSRVVGESYAWRRPGISGGALNLATNISNYITATGIITFFAEGHGLVVDDIVVIHYDALDEGGGRFARLIQRVVLSSTSGTGIDTFSVELIPEPMGGKINFNYCLKYSPYRDPETLEVGSLVSLDYFLPGVSSGVSTFLKIPVLKHATIYSVDGRETETVADNSKPTQTEYLADVKNNVMRIVTDSTVKRWKGNIFERATRYVITQ